MFQKIKSKIKVIPHQSKQFLNKDILTAGAIGSGKQCYFLVFCVVEEVYLVVTGGRAILGFIISYVITYVIYVMINWMAQIFYRCYLCY